MTTATANIPNLIGPDVRDDIFVQRVTRTPFTSRVKYGEIGTKLHTFTYYAQNAGAANAQTENYTYSSPSHADGTPVTHPSQIQTKAAELSIRAQHSSTIGTDDLMADKMQEARQDLGLDWEYAVWNGTGATTEPQQVRGLIGGVGYYDSTGSLPTAYQMVTYDGSVTPGSGLSPSIIRSTQLATRDKGGMWTTLWIPPAAKEDLRAWRSLNSEARTTVSEGTRKYSEGVDLWDGDWGMFESIVTDHIGNTNALGCDMDLCYEAGILTPTQWFNLDPGGANTRGFWYHDMNLMNKYPWYCAHFKNMTR